MVIEVIWPPNHLFVDFQIPTANPTIVPQTLDNPSHINAGRHEVRMHPIGFDPKISPLHADHAISRIVSDVRGCLWLALVPIFQTTHTLIIWTYAVVAHAVMSLSL
jgi:hypothetical protein